MNKNILFVAFNLCVATLFAGDSTTVFTSNAIENDTMFSVMSGVFTVGEGQEVPEDGKIIVKDADTEEVVGIYRPNKKTGKYLFILPPGKRYEIRYEVEGNLFKSENLIVPMSTNFKKIRQKINLGNL